MNSNNELKFPPEELLLRTLEKMYPPLDIHPLLQRGLDLQGGQRDV